MSTLWQRRFQWVLWAMAGLLVVTALPYWPWGFLLFVRIAVCAVSLAAMYFFGRQPISRLVTLVVVIAVFNPIVPPRLPPFLWMAVDVIAAYFFWSLGADLSARLSAQSDEGEAHADQRS